MKKQKEKEWRTHPKYNQFSILALLIFHRLVNILLVLIFMYIRTSYYAMSKKKFSVCSSTTFSFEPLFRPTNHSRCFFFLLACACAFVCVWCVCGFQSSRRNFATQRNIINFDSFHFDTGNWVSVGEC